MLKRALHVMMAAILGGTLGLAAWPQSAQALEPTVYNQPGDHYVNGRFWKTECDMYSSTVVRCTTNIWATKVIAHDGNYYNHNGWVFNNLTYLPSDRTQWNGNKLSQNTSWYAEDGRRWKSECDNATTGKGACRAYTHSTEVIQQNGKFVKRSDWKFNNIVQFATASVPPQTTVLPRSPNLPNMPVEKKFVPPAKPKPKPKPTTSFRADSRCNTGRVLCISKNQRKMAYMTNGTVQKVFDVRFGSELTPTRNGNWKLNWKSRNHVSSLYGSAMPFAMFFSGGQAVHYSSDFKARGYNGASKGCVNVRDYDGLKWVYDQMRTNDRIVVYN